MAKSSKQRERTDEDVADNHDAKPVLKKSKLDATGKAEVTKKNSKVKEDKPDPATGEDTPKSKKDKKDKKEKKEKKDKKDKKEKKRKNKDKDVETVAEPEEPAPAAPSTTETQPEEPANGDASTDKKSKKKNKKDKKKKNPTASSSDPQPATTTTAEDTTTGNSNKPTRFICFVGNLPYTATPDSVRAHFATLQPTSVRLLTQRDDPSKSRGIAFVEFGRYDHMKTCLEKFHHTEFDDGQSPARRINVELTYVFSPRPLLIFSGLDLTLKQLR
jgi:nucleolar protein 6